MEYDTFLRRVREQGDLPDDDAARTAIAAALVTLSERVPDEEARDLAEQLPTEIGESLATADGSDSFGYDEYVARVAGREADADEEVDPDLDAAEHHARAVIAVLLDAVQSRTSDDLLSYLSEDYEALLALVDPEEVWGPGWRDRLGQRA